MQVVLDCSAVAALLLEEDSGGDAEDVLSKAASGKASVIVPGLFWLEIVNVLVQAERRKRIPKGDAARIESYLLSLPIDTDNPPFRTAISRVRQIAAEHGLTAYDAAYIELADRVGARLLTRDEDILRLARHFPFIA